jgi:glycosidase
MRAAKTKAPYVHLFRSDRALFPSAIVLLAAAQVCQAQGLSFESRKARPEPAWMSKTIIYELWLGAFSKEGTLRGALQGLPRIADLGVTVVYLGPIAKHSSTPYVSPYNVADYNAVDPQYGTQRDLREFVTAAHKLQLKLMLDVVYYHSSPDNVAAKIPGFFVKTEDGKVARGFWPQPLPDFSNPEVRRYLVQSLVHWVKDIGVDGFRCDVGAGVPISFWEEARRELDRVNPEVILLSEADRPDDQLQAFDINYNFQYYLTLRSVLRDGAPALKIRENWENTKSTMPAGAQLLHFSDNHDWRRAVLEFGEKGALAASTLNFMLDGIPFLYNGQEIADGTPTHWNSLAPIDWTPARDTANQTGRSTLEKYKQLMEARKRYPALTEGEVIWINNTEPQSVLSFIRKKGRDEILVMLNVSNRQTHVTIDLPVMDYYAIDNVLTAGKTSFQLYSGRVSADLGAYDAVVGKRIPLAPLEKR